MNIDGKNRIKVAENAQQPCWSPDGKYIAYPPGEYPRYDPNLLANKGIEIYNLETREVKRHPNDEIYHIRDLCWSPDGEWFVYANRGILKVENKTRMFLTITGCTPDISPDGKRLAWNGTNLSLNIGKLDFDSPQSNVFDHRLKVACERDFWVFRADWSPDGNYLAFTYGFDDEDNQASTREPWSHVCICDLKTGKWTQITIDGKHNEHPDWVVVKADGL
jgi:Tol biopolymer transport system component